MTIDYYEYSAVGGFMNLVRALNNNPANGTGIVGLVNLAHNLMGPKIPQEIVDYQLGLQNDLFGGYPGSGQYIPALVFTAVFFILFLVHIALFSINFSRGHYFFPSFGWILHALGRTVGFAMYAAWSQDATKAKLGLASEFFLIVSSIVLVSFNLILAQRLFTWRHPVGGSRKLFWNFMFVLYGVVVAVVVFTVLASFVPYLDYISQASYDKWKQTVQASSILIILYSLTSISLIALSYFFKPTTKDENLYTYQPWWIESFSPFYFVRKNAARDAEETFMKRNHNHRHAIRVIAATHHYYNVVEGLTNQRGDLKHNISLLIVLTTTILIFVPAILRSVVCFGGRYAFQAEKFSSAAVMYVWWGGLETVVSLIYLVGRVDLRFYRPDILPQKVRAIITAEQSGFVSHNVSDDEESDLQSDMQSAVGSPENSFEFGSDEKATDYDGHDVDKKFEYETNDNESDFRF